MVDRFELVGQRIDPRDREAEVRVELPGDTECIGLQTETQESAPSPS